MTSQAINSDHQHSRAARTERLFRAAVTAYCALIRPSKNDATRLDDMTLPILSQVSEEGRRYAAAALSETAIQHCVLIRRLADEPVEISAPLLSRSQNLSDVDLIGLIGRHGIAHARAISRRPQLNSNIAKLITALGVVEETMEMVTASPEPVMPAPETEPAEAAITAKPDAAEDTRALLRGMMRPSAQKAEPAASLGDVDWGAAEKAYPKLLATAMSGSEALFDTTLADALDISFGAVRSLDDDEAPGLVIALRAMTLPLEKAFLIAALVYPFGFAGPGHAQDFVRNYRELDQASARTAITKWRIAEHQRRAASMPDWDVDPITEPANDDGEILQALRA